MVNTWERCYVCNVTSQQWWIHGGYPGATPPYSFRPNPTCFSLHNRRYFFAFQASGGKRGASLRSWRDKWECCSLPRAQESRQLRRLTRSERGTPDTLDGGRHKKNNAIYFFPRLSSCACLALFTRFTLTFARLKSLKTWNLSSSIMHGSIWHVTIPRG